MRPFFIVFLLILVGFEILILFPKQSDKPSDDLKNSAAAQNAQSQASNQVDQKMQGIHLVESQHGTRDWELFSESAQSYKNSQTWDLTNVKILFYNEEKQNFILRSESGKIDTQSKDMKFQGKVEIETSNGYIFVAPYVEYKSQDRLISCAGQVEVKGPMVDKKRSLFLKGTGMRIPVTTKKMYLDQNVSGEKTFANEKLVKIKSDKSELSSESQIAQFSGSVKIDYPPMNMTSNAATFAYNEKTKLFDYLDLNGKVELTEDNRRAVSENLKIDFTNKLMTFSGQPRLYQDDDELTGEKIIFVDNGKKVKVEKVNLKSDGKL